MSVLRPHRNQEYVMLTDEEYLKYPKAKVCYTKHITKAMSLRKNGSKLSLMELALHLAGHENQNE